MKKIILSLAIVIAASSVSFAARSHRPDDKSSEKKVEMKDRKKDKKRGSLDLKAGANPFEGIDLTAEQQTKLQELQKKTMAKKGEKSAEGKKDLTDAQKKEMKKEKMQNRQAETKEYLAGVKSILTPEQYVQFLENAYLNNGGQMARPAKVKGKEVKKASSPKLITPVSGN